MPDDPRSELQGLIQGYWKSQIVHALASLSIAECLAQRPASLATLSEKTGVNPDGLQRLLRGAASIGLVRVEEDRLFASTPMLEWLLENKPGSMRAIAIMLCSPGHWQPWGRFVEAVKTGEAQSVAALGLSHFDHYAANPAEAALFSKAMQSSSELVQAEVVRLLDTRGVQTAVDIGGANGALICAVAAANPSLKGIVFDLPHARDGAVAFIARQGLTDRVTASSGDFFDSVPPADLYLMKFILHDWDDDACVKLLSNCRRAMQDGGRIAVIELRLGPLGEPGLAPLLDLNMLVETGGRERTEREYGKLFAAGGLKLTSVKETKSPFSIYEGVSS
jgi:O-methyltransferase domain/Dimerisation domain